MHACSIAKLYLTLCNPMDQAPLSMRFSRQEYWSGLPFPLPRDLSDPGIEPASPAWAGGVFTAEPPGKGHIQIHTNTHMHIYIHTHTHTHTHTRVYVGMLVIQSCSALCNPIDCSSPGSSVHGILQALILERVAIPFSRGSS